MYWHQTKAFGQYTLLLYLFALKTSSVPCTHSLPWLRNFELRPAVWRCSVLSFLCRFIFAYEEEPMGNFTTILFLLPYQSCLSSLRFDGNCYFYGVNPALSLSSTYSGSAPTPKYVPPHPRNNWFLLPFWQGTWQRQTRLEEPLRFGHPHSSLNLPFKKRQLTPCTAGLGRAIIDSSPGASFPWVADWTECTGGGILNDSVGWC